MATTPETITFGNTYDYSGRTVVHTYCDTCYPTPELGDAITAPCGTMRHFLGDPGRDVDCVHCLALAALPCITCGHRF